MGIPTKRTLSNYFKYVYVVFFNMKCYKYFQTIRLAEYKQHNIYL